MQWTSEAPQTGISEKAVEGWWLSPTELLLPRANVDFSSSISHLWSFGLESREAPAPFLGVMGSFAFWSIPSRTWLLQSHFFVCLFWTRWDKTCKIDPYEGHTKGPILPNVLCSSTPVWGNVSQLPFLLKAVLMCSCSGFLHYGVAPDGQ